ncbi:MAG: hypothetical protein ACHP84_03160 [Caulobacterales bacterium]
MPSMLTPCPRRSPTTGRTAWRKAALPQGLAFASAVLALAAYGEPAHAHVRFNLHNVALSCAVQVGQDGHRTVRVGNPTRVALPAKTVINWRLSSDPNMAPPQFPPVAVSLHDITATGTIKLSKDLEPGQEVSTDAPDGPNGPNGSCEADFVVAG